MDGGIAKLFEDMLHEWPGARSILSNTAAVMVDSVKGAKQDKFEIYLADYKKYKSMAKPKKL